MRVIQGNGTSTSMDVCEKRLSQSSVNPSIIRCSLSVTFWCQRKLDPVSLSDRGFYGNPEGPGTLARVSHCHRGNSSVLVCTS